MTLTTRSFVRNLARVKEAAARGETVRVVDERSAKTFLFLEEPPQARKSLRAVIARDAGIYRDGSPDLSSREGFDD